MLLDSTIDLTSCCSISRQFHGSSLAKNRRSHHSTTCICSGFGQNLVIDSVISVRTWDMAMRTKSAGMALLKRFLELCDCRCGVGVPNRSEES